MVIDHYAGNGPGRLEGGVARTWFASLMYTVCAEQTWGYLEALILLREGC